MRKIGIIIFATFSILIHFQAAAQGGQEQIRKQEHFDKGAFEARRNAFITAKLELTPEEAAQFIPLYVEMQQKLFEVGRESRKINRKIHHKESSKQGQTTDAEYTQAIYSSLDAYIKEAELKKAYYERFKEVLSPKKLYLLDDAESKFMRSFWRRGERNKD
ncbi:MAG: hypothetical protein SO287_12630 [Parabacteroides sp.]|nr:hypothetical protein [Parabacteroides sp.]MCI7008887.1 hypothetical protein [Parabacteroides sp.]MCI7782692.1 hypothetical protein [Parabacteroides sp.]MDD7062132.1 hypothetical protein [bacterium]MDY4758408.1 hypothetical protein [Parabacteroides sp.]